MTDGEKEQERGCEESSVALLMRCRKKETCCLIQGVRRSHHGRFLSE